MIVPDYLKEPSLDGHLYGKLTYSEEDDLFVLKGEPLLLQYAKRIFPGAKVTRGGGGRLEFHRTRREVADLNWLLMRFPVDVSQCKDVLGYAREEAIGQLNSRMSGHDTKRVKPPSDFKGVLYPFQEQAVSFLTTNKRSLLSDGMGLGKSFSCLGAAAVANEYPVLVVCQTHVQKQWQRLIGTLFDMKGVHGREDMTPFDLATKNGEALAPILSSRTPYKIPDAPFAIIHYGLIAWWQKALIERRFKTVIFDEVQELRHTGTGKYSAASLISERAEYVMANSGTPVFGYGREIWSVMNAIDFHCLGSEEAFTREWCTGYGEKIVGDPKALNGHLSREGLMLRRRATDPEVAIDLPKVIRKVQDLEHDEVVYDELIGAARDKAKAYDSAKFTMKGRLARDIDRESRQAAGISKARYVAEFVASLIEAGERPLVFAWHHAVHDMYRERLKQFNPAIFTGKQSTKQKDDSLKKFMNGETPVALMSLRSAAGLDGLQHRASMCVFGELDWSPAVFGQCLDDQTEVLTRRGFVGPDDIKRDDEVAAFSLDDNSVLWQAITGRVDRGLLDGEEMYSISSRAMDVRVTGGHRMVYRAHTGHGAGSKRDALLWRVVKADTLSRRSQGYTVPCAGYEDVGGLPLSDDEIRLLGWYLTDGSLNERARQLVIYQSEGSPFNGDIRAMLDRGNFHYRVHVVKGTTNYGGNFDRLRYGIPKFGPRQKNGKRGWSSLRPYLSKELNELYEDIDARQLGILLGAMSMGDGAKRDRQVGFDIGSRRKITLERLQSLCARRGWRCNLSERKTPMGKPYYEIRTKNMSHRRVGGASCKDREVFSVCKSSPGERVWCVENDVGTLVVRRKGKVAVVGNCETRIARIGVDGSLPDVPSYYCVASVGHDEAMMDVLGVKTGQFIGIMGDEPESYEEKKESEERAANRIGLLVDKLKNEDSQCLKKDAKEAKIETVEVVDGTCSRTRAVGVLSRKLKDGGKKEDQKK